MSHFVGMWALCLLAAGAEPWSIRAPRATYNSRTQSMRYDGGAVITRDRVQLSTSSFEALGKNGVGLWQASAPGQVHAQSTTWSADAAGLQLTKGCLWTPAGPVDGLMQGNVFKLYEAKYDSCTAVGVAERAEGNWRTAGRTWHYVGKKVRSIEQGQKVQVRGGFWAEDGSQRVEGRWADIRLGEGGQPDVMYVKQRAKYQGQEGVVLADEAVYRPASGLLLLYGNVVWTKDKQRVYGRSATVQTKSGAVSVDGALIERLKEDGSP